MYQYGGHFIQFAGWLKITPQQTAEQNITVLITEYYCDVMRKF